MAILITIINMLQDYEIDEKYPNNVFYEDGIPHVPLADCYVSK